MRGLRGSPARRGGRVAAGRSDCLAQAGALRLLVWPSPGILAPFVAQLAGLVDLSVVLGGMMGLGVHLAHRGRPGLVLIWGSADLLPWPALEVGTVVAGPVVIEICSEGYHWHPGGS